MDRKQIKIAPNLFREMAIEKAHTGKDLYELAAEAWACYKRSRENMSPMSNEIQQVLDGEQKANILIPVPGNHSASDDYLAQAVKLSEISRLAGEIQEFLATTPRSGTASESGAGDDQSGGGNSSGKNRPARKVAGGRR